MSLLWSPLQRLQKIPVLEIVGEKIRNLLTGQSIQNCSFAFGSDYSLFSGSASGPEQKGRFQSWHPDLPIDWSRRRHILG
jgi:hypothetical protein